MNDESLNAAGLLPARLSYIAPPTPAPPRLLYWDDDACACWNALVFVVFEFALPGAAPRLLACG